MTARFRPRKAGECGAAANEKNSWCQMCNREWWLPLEMTTPFICPPCKEVKHCCVTMQTHVLSEEVAIVCFSGDITYGIKVLDGGSSFIKIAHCPWCGVGLV